MAKTKDFGEVAKAKVAADPKLAWDVAVERLRTAVDRIFDTSIKGQWIERLTELIESKDALTEMEMDHENPAVAAEISIGEASHQ